MGRDRGSAGLRRRGPRVPSVTPQPENWVLHLRRLLRGLLTTEVTLDAELSPCAGPVKWKRRKTETLSRTLGESIS